MNGKTAWFCAFLAIASVTLLSCGSGQKVRSAGLPTASVYSNLGKVAYELDGDIYVKSLPDGEPQRVANGTMPRWSPSGEWLLFWDNGSDWLSRADGTERHALPNWLFPEDPRIVPSAIAAWSPERDVLAYAAEGALFVENADGSGKREVTALETYPRGLLWSPDGERLAYGQETAPLPARRASLWVAEVDGTSKPVELYGTTTDGILVAGWTSNSENVLFWRDVSFSASAMADGLPLEAIPAQGGRPLALAAGHLALWDPSPVDERIAMTVPPGRETWTQKRVAIVDAGTAVLQYLTPEDRVSIQPSWSPDGRQIAFVSKPDAGDGPGGPGVELEKMASDRRIWVMNSDGSNQRPLTDGPAYRDEHPEWSADGSSILFARLDSDRLASLWLMSSEGGAPEQVVDRIESSADGLTGYYTNIAWGGLFDWWRPTSEKTSSTPVPRPTSQPQPNPSAELHPLLSGHQAEGGTVTTDQGTTILVTSSRAGFLWQFAPGDRWLVTEADGEKIMSGTVIGEAVQYESVYGFVRLDDSRAVAYMFDEGANWVVYPAAEICRQLGQIVPIPSAYVVDGVIQQEAVLHNMCDDASKPATYRKPCRDKMTGVIRGIAICTEGLGIYDGVQIVP